MTFPGDDSKATNSQPEAYRREPTVIEEKNGGRVTYDIPSRLLEDRIIKVEGVVDEVMASQISNQLLYLDSQNQTKPITLYINSPGGAVTHGLAIYDVIQHIKSPVRTVGMGINASMGSILLAAGGKRQMMEHTELMVHQILSGNNQSQASDLALSNAHTEKLHERLKDIYVAHTGLKHEFWDVVAERDTYFSAQEALEMGFIHKVASAAEDKIEFSQYAKRERQGLSKALNDTATSYIENMSTDEIISKLNSVSAESSLLAPYRARMVVKLAQDPQFWTEGLKAKKAASNDNAGTTTNKKKQPKA